MHATSKQDQFLMKLRPDFEIACSNLMNRYPIPSLDACLSELLREEQHIVTQAAMEHQVTVSAPFLWLMWHRGDIWVETYVLSSALVVKLLAILLRIVLRSFVTTCPKKQGHIISTCPIRPERKQGTTYHASTAASSSAALPTASPVVPLPAPTALANPSTLTPEMVQ